MSEKKKIFIHKYLTEHRINDEKKTIEEFLRDGEKGISFTSMNLSKGKKDSYKKVSGKELEDGNFGITIKIDGEVKEENMNKKELMALIKKHKELAFIEKYMTKDMEKFRKTLKGGKRKTSKKKSSKKSSKKKTSKKSSKKKSKRSSKKKASKKKASLKKSSKKRKSSKKKLDEEHPKKKSSKRKSSKKKSKRKN